MPLSLHFNTIQNNTTQYSGYHTHMLSSSQRFSSLFWLPSSARHRLIAHWKTVSPKSMSPSRPKESTTQSWTNWPGVESAIPTSEKLDNVALRLKKAAAAAVYAAKSREPRTSIHTVKVRQRRNRQQPIYIILALGTLRLYWTHRTTGSSSLSSQTQGI